MKRRTSAKKRLLLFGGAAIGVVLLAVAVLFGDLSEADFATGTMGESAAVSMDLMDARWTGAVLSGAKKATLGDEFEADVTLRNASLEARNVSLELFFSRDEAFDQSEDCRLDEASKGLLPGESAGVKFRVLAHTVNCLDAGPWHVAVYSADLDEWEEIEGIYEVEGGEAHLRIAELSSEVAHQGDLELTLEVNRPSTSVGAMGLWEHPVDLWLSDGDDLCLLPAASMTLARDAVRRKDGEWVSTRVQVKASLADAKRVSNLRDHPNPFEDDMTWQSRECEDCRPPDLGRSCRLGEGVWKVMAGPTSAAFQEVGSVFHHAPPARIEDSVVRLTLGEGEVGFIERRANNPSKSSVTWSARASGAGQDWMVGMSNQVMEGGAREDLRLTISAADLSPGVYTGDYMVEIGDHYNTAAAIPVELTVLASRKGAATQPDQKLAVSNYPNPFSGRTTLVVEIAEEGPYRLVIFDVQGREIRLVLDEWMSSGMQEIPFDASGMPSGNYLYRLTGDQGAVTGSMSILR